MTANPIHPTIKTATMSAEQSIPLSEYLVFLSYLSAPALLLGLGFQTFLFANCRAFAWRSAHRVFIGYALTLILSLPLTLLATLLGAALEPACCKHLLSALIAPTGFGPLVFTPVSLVVIALITPFSTWCALLGRKAVSRPATHY